MSLLNLESITTTEAIIINKEELAGEQIKLTIAKKVIPEASNKYIGECIAEMYKENEEDVDILSRSFNVKVSVKGIFHGNTPDIINNDVLHDEAFQQLLPHLRANMAALMGSAGLTPYLIPNSLIANNE